MGGASSSLRPQRLSPEQSNRISDWSGIAVAGLVSPYAD